MGGRMEMEEDILLGRVNRLVEKNLGLSLTTDVRIFGRKEHLDNLAKSHPNSYLGILDEVSDVILKDPDYVCFDEAEGVFYFMETYWKNGALTGVEVKVTHEGKPKRWVFHSLRAIRNPWDRNYVKIRKKP